MLYSNRQLRLLHSFFARCFSTFNAHTIAGGYYNVHNFGDQLTPLLLQHFGFKCIPCPNFRFADVIGVGSILHKVPDLFGGTILGAGFIHPEAKSLPNAKVLLIRGLATKRLLGIQGEVSVGDPGLIVDTIFPSINTLNQTWDIGIVPHYNDSKTSFVEASLEWKGNLRVKLIDVKRTPFEVVSEIAACRSILSSSLHGLIVADSFGIPNAWLQLSNNLIGGRFKFDDYYSALDEKRDPITPDSNDSPDDWLTHCRKPVKKKVEAVQQDILKAYNNFAKLRLEK